MKIGTTELILILVVALVVFGPSKLPELGKLAGQAVGSFKRYVNSFEGEWKESTEPSAPQTHQAAVQSECRDAGTIREEASPVQSQDRSRETAAMTSKEAAAGMETAV